MFLYTPNICNTYKQNMNTFHHRAALFSHSLKKYQAAENVFARRESRLSTIETAQSQTIALHLKQKR